MSIKGNILRPFTFVAFAAAVLLLAAPGFAWASHAKSDTRYSTVLSGGLKVVAERSTAEVYAACVFVDVGSALEAKDKNGITSLLNGVILSGTPGVSLMPVPAIERLGGRIDVVTNSEYVCFMLSVPSAGFAEALGILADAIAAPTITDGALDSQKSRLAATADMARDNPEIDAYRAFLARTYEGTPYAFYPGGWCDSAETLGAAELGAWHSKHYGTNSLLVSVCAGDDPELAAAMVAEAFGGEVLAVTGFTAAVTGPARAPVMRTERYVETSLSGGSAAMLGYTAPPMDSPDYAAVKLLEAVVAEGMGSRLFKSLRGEDGVAYSFGSILPETNTTSRLAFYVSADSDKLERAIEAVKVSVDSLKADGLGPAELDRARAALIGRMKLGNEDPLDRARQNGLYEMMGLGTDYGERLKNRIAATGVEEIREVARRYLDKYTLVILKPESRIR